MVAGPAPAAWQAANSLLAGEAPGGSGGVPPDRPSMGFIFRPRFDAWATGELKLEVIRISPLYTQPVKFTPRLF